MSSKHQSRLVAALAAIAFALVAVVGMPKVALAASSVSELAKAINNGTNAATSLQEGTPVYYSGNTVYVVGECNGGGSGISDIWMHLKNEDVNLNIGEKGSIKFAQGSQLIIVNDTSKDVAFNISGSGSITGGGVYKDSNNYAAIQVGGQSESKNLSGNLNISETVTVNGQQGSPALTVTFGSTASVTGGKFVGGGDGKPGGQAVINVGEPEKGREGTLTVSGDVTVTANKVESGNACMALCVSNGTAALNGGTFTGGGMNATKKARISAVGVGSQLLDGDGSVFPGDLIVNGAKIQAPEDNPSGGGIAVYGTSELTVRGNSDVSGGRAVSTQGECNGATINIEGGTFTGANDGAAFYLPNNGKAPVNDVNISGGTISGGVGIVNLGSDVSITGTPGPTITSTAEDETVGAGDSGITFPAAGIVNTVADSESYGAGTTTSVTGGTVNNGIVNGVTGDNSNIKGDPQLTVGGSATVNATGGETETSKPAITNNSGSTTVDDGTINGSVVNGADKQGYGENTPSVEMNGGSVNVPSGSNALTNNAGTTTVTNGEINGNVQNNNDGTTNLNGGTVNGNVANEEASGSLNVGQQNTSTGPTINGEATGAGTTVNSGTVTEGVGDGAVSAPSTPTPGAGTTVDNYVQGAVGPVQSAASGYAEVTVSNDLKTWTVDVTNAGETTPLATVADNVVAQVISAIQRGGSGKVTSGSLSLDLPASQADIQAFSLKVLQAAIGIPTQATDGPVASDLIGRTVTVTATTNTGSITYTFAFTGEGTPVTVYRLWNKLNGAHLFTSDENEYNVLTAEHPGEWIGEGARFTEPAQGTEPVYRLYNPNNGDHFFTKSEAEADTLSTIGWRIESANWYSGGDVDVMRFYNPSQVANEGLGNHLWTAEAPEIAALPSMGYVAEGLGWNALSVLQ